MNRLLATAGITPRTTAVRSGEAELSRITGARTPSGVPVVITVPAAERPRPAGATGSRSSRGRRGRPGGRSRSAAAGDAGRRGRHRPSVRLRPGRLAARPPDRPRPTRPVPFPP
ncbi:hypothetical protein SFUMM280S_03318 [Streptomyces fumanus]